MSQQRKKRVAARREFFTRLDGTIFPVAVTASPVIIEGKPVGAVAVFRDITRELEIEQTRQEFVALASHQLRTPISIIKWYAQILAKHGDNLSNTQNRYLGEINGASNRMNNLVKTLLDISKIETGKYLVEPADINLGEYVSRIVSGLRSQADLKSIAIRERYSKKPIHLETDPKVVRVAVENLLSNAIKYSKANRSITVEVAKHPTDSELGGRLLKHTSAAIMVKDRGAGIPKVLQQRIFKHLFTPTGQGSSGLGLYLTKAVVSRVGGKIWFNSHAGRGSTFYVSFPLEE